MGAVIAVAACCLVVPLALAAYGIVGAVSKRARGKGSPAKLGWDDVPTGDRGLDEQ